MSTPSTEPSTHPRASGRWLGGITVVYAAMAVLMTWPMAGDLSTHIMGGGWDGPMFVWNTWWAPFAVFGLNQDPLFTDYLMHPVGSSLIVNTHCVLPALLSTPFQWVFGVVPAYNLMVLATFALSGLAACLLANEVLDDRRAAFVVGVMYAFCHTRISMVGFFNLIQTQFLVFYLWALWCTYRRRSFGFALLAGLFATTLVFTSYNLLLLAALFTVALGLFTLYENRGRPGQLPGHLARWTLMTALLIFLGWPVLQGLWQELYAGETEFVAIEDSKSYHEAIPVQRHLVRGPLQDNAADAPLRQAAYWGWVVVGFAAIGVWRRDRTLAFWLAIAVVFLWLSLGPRWNWDGPVEPESEEVATSAWFPFTWTSKAPVLKELRVAHRYGLLGALALALVAGYGVRALLSVIGRHRAVGVPVTAVLAAATVFDFADVPFPRTFELPSFPAADVIADDRRDCCVLEFPGGRRGYPSFSYFQTMHEKPVYLDGQIARLSPTVKERQAESTLRTVLLAAMYGNGVPQRELSRLKQEIHAEVQEHRIGWLVIAWADQRSAVRGRGFFDPRALTTVDQLMQALLPIEEVVHTTTLEDYQQWRDLKRRARQSAPAMWRVYRLALDAAPAESAR